MPFYLVRDNIVNMQTDIIVNATGPDLGISAGVCGAIFRALDSDNAYLLLQECDRRAPCPPGECRVTHSYGLSTTKYIVHTVGPIWKGGNDGEAALLERCYYNSLCFARYLDCRSIAFPLISTGNFKFPKEEALHIAWKTILKYLAKNKDNLLVYLVVYDPQSVALSKKLEDEIRCEPISEYIRRRGGRDAPLSQEVLDKVKELLEASFTDTLFHFLNEKGYAGPEVYKRANMSKQLFAKICKDRDYHPQKKTALALAIGLQLSLAETKDFLQRAGYSLSPSQTRDVIISYFLLAKNYDIYEINAALEEFGEETL